MKQPNQASGNEGRNCLLFSILKTALPFSTHGGTVPSIDKRPSSTDGIITDEGIYVQHFACEVPSRSSQRRNVQGDLAAARGLLRRTDLLAQAVPFQNSVQHRLAENEDTLTIHKSTRLPACHSNAFFPFRHRSRQQVCALKRKNFWKIHC